MSFCERIGLNMGMGGSRKSTREKKHVQHFGVFESGENLEEMIEAPEHQKPSLVVRLPLLQASLPPTPKKRSRAVLSDGNATAKRRRVQQASAIEADSTQSINENRPEPRGRPEVWAEVRQALSESLPYYHAFRSAAYTWGTEKGKGGYVFGLLLDNDNDKRGYMGEKVIITRTAGGAKINTKTGNMELMDDHSSDSSSVTIFSNNQSQRVPIVVIVGAKNAHCPTKVPHRYNVLGMFQVTDSWSERVKGITLCRIRLEMIDLKTPSWWGIKGSPDPTRKPDYLTKAVTKTCSTCGMASKQRYIPGWMCANEKCTEFSTINGYAVIEPPAFDPVFLNERNRWPAQIKAPFLSKPAPPTALLNNPDMETSLAAWKGMVCPRCGRCNSRTHWDEWKCATEGCTFELPIHYTVRPANALTSDHGFEAEGHSISFDKYEESVVRSSVEFHGYWRKATYELFPGNFVTHYFANQQINRQPGGPDEILEALQGVNLGMKRHVLDSAAIEGDMLTRHFGINFGLPYKFVAAPDSTGFSEAPPAILDALNHLIWAGRDAIRDGSYRAANELLCLAYMEDQRINMHDDGEKDLGPDIASISLGGSATMKFAMKPKYYLANNLTAKTYDPTAHVWPGSQGWELRVAANELYKAGRMAEYETAKKELFAFLQSTSEKRKRTAPAVLTLELKHGDMVVMHGERIQQIYEHGVQPKGKLRYGLTARYIKPENIPADQHWKGDFTIPPEKVYDGDLALFKAHYPEEEEEEET